MSKSSQNGSFALVRPNTDETLHRFVNPRLFKFHEDMRERVCEARDFTGGVIGQNLALEGLALGFFEFNAALLHDVDPGTAHILNTVLLDERRHVGFGLVRLQEILEEEPENSTYVEDTVGELSNEIMAFLEENADLMANQGLESDRRHATSKTLPSAALTPVGFGRRTSRRSFDLRTLTQERDIKLGAARCNWAEHRRGFAFREMPHALSNSATNRIFLSARRGRRISATRRRGAMDAATIG
ncbi:MAG: hypothetical protein GY822_24355 [Deltaproteobacteria bacterium]|nr:hypothetical protein [Deltaproteobacteria bacterium]